MMLHGMCVRARAPTGLIDLQTAEGFGMVITFDQFKSMILGGSKDSGSFNRKELELAFGALQSYKDAKGRIHQPRLLQLLQAFGPKCDRDATRKKTQIIREYTHDSCFDYFKLLQALEDENILTKAAPVSRAKAPKTPGSKGQQPATNVTQRFADI
jgi:hypothetical protein